MAIRVHVILAADSRSSTPVRAERNQEDQKLDPEFCK